MKNLLSLKQLSNEEINEIIDLGIRCKNEDFSDKLKGKIAASLFFEPSTRTQYSFNVALERLGCKVVSFNPVSSSLLKGESFYDTVKTFDSFDVDALIIRDKQDGYYNELVGNINAPIINAGDGKSDHPTQNLLDLMTIKEHFGGFEGLNVVIVGDIKHSRVAHGNIEVMERLGMKVKLSAPECYRDDNDTYCDLDEAIEDADIIMLLRVQNERHEETEDKYELEYNEKYGMNEDRVLKMKDNAIIMHPAPFNRNVEITDSVVECSKSKIFEQMSNGVYVRMAVLMKAMGE